MRSGTPIEQRNIALVPFPFSDFRGMKRRPVLVLSRTAFNAAQHDAVVCQITSKLTDDPYAVPLTAGDLEEGTLKRESKVKPYRITAVDQQLIGKQIEKISESKFQEVLKALQRCLSRFSHLLRHLHIQQS